MSEEAVIAQKTPYQVEVVEGETYHWCACGRSKKNNHFAMAPTKAQAFYQ